MLVHFSWVNWAGGGSSGGIRDLCGDGSSRTTSPSKLGSVRLVTSVGARAGLIELDHVLPLGLPEALLLPLGQAPEPAHELVVGRRIVLGLSSRRRHIRNGDGLPVAPALTP